MGGVEGERGRKVKRRGGEREGKKEGKRKENIM